MVACRSRAALAVLAVAAFLSCASATNYTVGDKYGWRRPPATNPGYFDQWSKKYTFFLADLITFDSQGANSNVVNIGASEYEVCNTTDPGGQYTHFTPVTFRFPEVGDYYFASGIAGDCLAGLKVKITISASSGGATPPPGRASPPPTSVPVAPPPSSSAPPPGSPSDGGSSNLFFVGGETVGWTIPSTASFYTDWAESVAPLYVDSDRLVFIYDNQTHDVSQLDAVPYRTCDTSSPLVTFYTGQDVLGPNQAGTFYFTSSQPGDCSAGMRFSIQYLPGSRPADNAPASPPVGATPPATPPPFFLPPPVAPITSPPASPPTSAVPPTPVPVTPPTSSAPPPSVPPTVPPSAPPTVPPTAPSTVPPISPLTVPPTGPPTVPPTSPPPASPPTSLAPPPLAVFPPPPPPIVRAPPPPPPRIPPPPPGSGLLPPGLTVPPGLSIPPGFTVPPGVGVPPGALSPPGSAAIAGARVGTLLLLAALGLSLLVLS